MKRIVYLFVALLMMATADAQTLTERQKGLAACACLMAQGDMNRLEPTVRMALNKGVTINELKEAFSQLYAYTGFPRSLNALGVLSKVLENGRSSESHPSLLEDGRVALDEGVANKDLPMPPSRGLLFHPDLLYGTSLGKKIKDYSFFDYGDHESLHLSQAERTVIMALIRSSIRSSRSFRIRFTLPRTDMDSLYFVFRFTTYQPLSMALETNR